MGSCSFSEPNHRLLPPPRPHRRGYCCRGRQDKSRSAASVCGNRDRRRRRGSRHSRLHRQCPDANRCSGRTSFRLYGTPRNPTQTSRHERRGRRDSLHIAWIIQQTYRTNGSFHKPELYVRPSEESYCDCDQNQHRPNQTGDGRPHNLCQIARYARHPVGGRNSSPQACL